MIDRSKPLPIHEFPSLISEVARLKELETKATPGPWGWYADDYSLSWIGQIDNDQENFVLGAHVCDACAKRHARCLQPKQEDAEIITDLRNAAPKLLNVLSEIRAGDRQLLADALGEMEEIHHGML